MKNRIVSFLLAFAVVLGMIPAVAAEPADRAEQSAIEIDFKESAIRASEQSFWSGLAAVKTSDGNDAVRIGRKYGSSEEKSVVQAYEQLCAWLWENEGWTIDDDTATLTGSGGNMVYLSADEDLDWGLDHVCYYQGHSDTRSNLALQVEVPAEGWYNMNLEVSLSNSKNTDVANDGIGNAGGAYVDVFVNGKPVYDDYCTVGDKKVVSSSLGQVYLEAGTNDILLHTAKNYWAQTNAVYRSNVNLCSMTFTPFEGVDTVVGAAAEVDLCAIYLPFDADTSKVWAEVKDPELAEATVTNGILKIKGLAEGETAVDVYDGDTFICTIDVTVLPMILESFKAEIPGNTTGQIPRLAPQTIKFDMTSNGGLTLTPKDVDFSYTVSDEDVLSFDEETLTVTGLCNGTATLTFTAEKGGTRLTETMTFTVGDTGENLIAESSSFDGGAKGKWTGLQGRDVENARAWTEIADDGTGNFALKVTANPAVSDATGKGGAVTFANGSMVKATGGHLYELSFRIKAENYVQPEGAQNPWAITVQLYDYLGNSTSSTLLREYLASTRIFANTLTEDYVEYTVPILAPIDYEGDVYLVPRLTFNANSGYAPLNKELLGFEGTFWLDDFKLSEVGYEMVELTPAAEMTKIETPTAITMIPMTTTGKAIGLDKGAWEGKVSVWSTNEDVVTVESDFGKTTVNSYEYPTVKAQLVGLNAPAEVVAEMTVGSLTRQGSLDLSPTDLPNVLRDLVYLLDGSASAVLPVGQTAKGSVIGRTTQLETVPEEIIRAGGVYFTSSDPKIASVDTVTGDVTCHNEGTATVTAYVILDGVTRKVEATVTVTDDTDLTSIGVTAPVDYVGTGNFIQVEATGLKASGVCADMSLYPVAWSLDDAAVLGGLAEITEDGMLYAYQAGTVTATASVSVEGELLTASMDLDIIPNSQLPGKTVFYDLTLGRSENVMDLTVEKDGFELDRENTYLGGKELQILAAGLRGIVPTGESIAFDVVIPKDGWYLAEIRGGRTYAGVHAGGFVDDQYIGHIYFDVENKTQYNNFGGYNTVYLTAGVHNFRLTTTYRNDREQTFGGIRFYAVQEPKPMDVSLTAEKTTLVAGEQQEVKLSAVTASLHTQTLMQVVSAPTHTNYYMISSSNEEVVSLSGMTMTAHAAGEAVITALCDINGEKVTVELPITVEGGTIARAELTAEDTTVRPNVKPFPVCLELYGADGNKLVVAEEMAVTYESGNTEVAAIAADGTVTLTGTCGSALLTAKVTEEGRTVEASFWLTVTEGKLEPSIYTYEERANARANVLKYDWAWKEKEAAVRKADYYVENLDHIYDMWIREKFPRSNQVGYNGDTGYRYCRYCGVDIVGAYGHYPWIVDPIENPWKITCPMCKRDFPSNDFASYYESGLDETGHFDPARADEQYLVNELYPEMGEGWGVDDGWGYVTGEKDASGKPETHTYINYYMLAMIDGLGDSKHDMFVILEALRDAYLYTGDERYGNAGAILTDRLADIYPEYSMAIHENWSWYSPWSGSDGRGKLSYQTWDGSYGIHFAKAYDAFFDCFDNEPVVTYLRTKAAFKSMEPEDITPDYIRKHVEDDLILGFFQAHKDWQAMGNFGMSQQSLAACAVAIDRMPESQQIVDYLFNTQRTGRINGKPFSTGGDVLRVIVENICRDGIGNEGSFQYNGIWPRDMLNTAKMLEGFDLVEGADLWKNQKFVNMYLGLMRLTVCGHLYPQYGEAGFVQTTWGYGSVDELLAAYLGTGDPEFAKAVYAVNGNSVEGLRTDIFTKDPEAIRNQILQTVRAEGTWLMNESDMLCGHGMAILRKGPETYLKGINDDEFFDYNMAFNHTGESHAQLEMLRLDMEAFGLNLSGSMGYPLLVDGSDAMRMQWVRHTVSDNTVLVNDSSQLATEATGFPMHFADSGKVKVMDVDASHAYAETDIYRRTVVTVEAPNGVDYAVDLFRVLGGSEHVYSFHGATRKDPTVTGLSMVEQPFGTYAGADVAFGYESASSEGAMVGSGYNWLYNVSRDNDPEKTFSIDWQIEDFHHRLATSAGIHLNLTMLSEEPMTEVALADGQPPQNGNNPDHLEYVMIRRSGEEGMDTLFTAVIEPWQGQKQVVKAELVDMVLIDGTETATDRAAAIKTTMVTGRVDYIVYATNVECTYLVDDTFEFRGSTGVVSYENGRVTYAWGSEATKVTDAVEEAQASFTGTVLDFTKGLTTEGYTITVKTDTPATAAELTGRYIYIDNDGLENAVYPIRDAKVSGDTAVLYLGDKTLVRAYIDAMDLEKGFKYNISEGDTYKIPLTAHFDVEELFTHTADIVVKAGNKLSITTGAAGAGVHYEAVGLPTGAKFDSKTGLIGWMPSRTQTGRYPITVKAVDAEGDVLGEMSFVIYAVSYTGSGYEPSVCSHSKAVTYTVDGVVETVCPACGMITKTEATVSKIVFAGSNMTLGNELEQNFMVATSDLKDGYKALITHNGEIREAKFRKYNSAYSCVSYSVAAKEMADPIEVVVVDADGNAVSEVYTSSVRDYAMKALVASTSSSKVKTMVVDMLNYGAAAQTYFGYNTEDLANAKLTEAQKALATGDVSCTDRRVQGKNYYGSNLSLEDKILLNLYFKNCTEGMTAKVTFKDHKGKTVTADAELVKYSGKIFKVEVDEVVLADAFCDVTVTVYDGENVHGSATDSVESYVARSEGSDLYLSIIKFAASAYDYLVR